MASEVLEKGGLHDRARIVRRYLSALDARKPGRSASRTAESVQHRMHQIDTLLLSADPVQRLHLTQERIDLHAEHLRLQGGVGGEFEALEKAFVRVAKSYGDRHEVTYSAWRQVGVDAEVLASAGIHPQVKPNRKADAAGKADAGSVAGADPAAVVAPAEAAPSEAKAAPSKPAASNADAPKAEAAKKPVAKKAPSAKKSGNGATAQAAKKPANSKPAKKPAAPQPEQQQLPAGAS